MWSEFQDFQRRRSTRFSPHVDLADPPLASPLGWAGSTLPLAAVKQVAAKVIGRPPLTIEPLVIAGASHSHYRARWDNGPNAILRFNPHKGPRDFALLLDPWAMDLLREAGLPALQVLDVDLSRCLCPWDYEVLEEAPGQSLREMDHDETLLTPYLVDLGRLVARLHQTPAEGFGLLALDSLSPQADVPVQGMWSNWQDYLNQNLDDHLRLCLSMEAINLGESHAIHCLFTARNPRWAYCTPRLLHGDLENHKLFGQNGQITALIDWENCLAGDPLFEIAHWAAHHPRDRHAPFFQGYQSVEPFPADFEDRFWLYFLRIALARTAQRHRSRGRDLATQAPTPGPIQMALGRLGQRRLAAA